MAGEHTVEIETHIPINFTKGTGTAITKGAFLKMTDNMVAILADGDGDIVAGVAQSDALSGDTSVAVYRGGVFRGLAEGTITVGDGLITGASTGSANSILTAAVNSENLLGIALESATDGTTFLYELSPQTVNLA